VSRRALLSFVVAGALLLLLPSLGTIVAFPTSHLVFLYFMSFWVAQATSWTILSGFTGYFSFGQAAFFGVGVYTSADLVTEFGWNYFVTVPLAGLAGLILGLVVGAVAFRLRSLRGEIFALLTLIVTLILATVARVSTFVDGGQGRQISVPEYPSFLGEFSEMIYRLGVVVALVAVAAAYAIQHSRFGWGLFVIRDREDVAEGVGVPTFRYKMMAIGISGFLAGASGSVYALQIGFVTIEQVFGLTVPLFVIVMSVLGGRDHWLGPVLGAVIVFTLQDRLVSAGLESWNQIIIGGILVVLVIFVGEGLYQRGAGRWAPAGALLVLGTVVLAATGAVDGLIDAFAFALAGAVLILFLPVERLPWSQPGRRRLQAAASTHERRPP
jgi:ABC-type branched-subunit amino acid transport system permease subunit